MHIIQIVGYKNSGKTTLICNLVNTFKNKGFNVATLKHHGHGGKPDVLKGTDTYKHSQAGATMTGVEGDETLQLTIHKNSWTIDQILAFYRLMELDLLLIEGYKELDFNKIVLINKNEDLKLLDNVSNIKLVIVSMQMELLEDTFDVIHDAKEDQISNWVSRYLNQTR